MLIDFKVAMFPVEKVCLRAFVQGWHKYFYFNVCLGPYQSFSVVFNTFHSKILSHYGNGKGGSLSDIILLGIPWKLKNYCRQEITFLAFLFFINSTFGYFKS